MGAAVLWGTVGPAEVMARSPLTAPALGGWRLLIGGLVLWVVAARGPGTMRLLLARAARWPLTVCAVSTGLYQMTFLYSVSRAGAALATAVALGTAPVATGLAAWWIGGDRITPKWSVSTAAAIVGCLLLLTPGQQGADPRNLFLGVVSGACVGAYTVYAQRLAADNPRLPLPAAAAASLLIGSLVLVPWMVVDTGPLTGVPTLTLVLWLGVVTTALAYWLFFFGITRLSAGTVGTLSLAEPMASALLGVLLLGEKLSPAALAGCALLLGGLVIASLPSMSRGRTEADTSLMEDTIVLPRHTEPRALAAAGAWSSTATVRFPAIRAHSGPETSSTTLFPPFQGDLHGRPHMVQATRPNGPGRVRR